jgi:hypothetical protein
MVSKYPHFLISLLFVILSACTKPDPYSFEYHFPEEYDRMEQFAKIISYVYVSPPATDPLERTKAEHRNWYKGRIPEFEMLRYHIDETGLHHFYLLRPARSASNNKRGVGGVFRLNEQGEIMDYDEIWVTPIIPAEDVKRFADYFWPEFLKTGFVATYASMPNMVEFPGELSYYDQQFLEWRYKLDL